MHIDPLDAAAGLAGIEHGAVHKILDGVGQVGIGAHIGGIAAAELETQADEAIGRRLHDGVAGGDAAGEVHIVDPVGADQLQRVVVGHVQMLEQALGQAGFLEGGGEALGAERRLRRMLEDHRIAGHQRRHDAVDRGEIGIVPGRHDEDHAQRLAADEAGEAGPRVGRHVARAPRARSRSCSGRAPRSRASRRATGRWGGRSGASAPRRSPAYGRRSSPRPWRRCGRARPTGTCFQSAWALRAAARASAICFFVASLRVTSTLPSIGVMVFWTSAMATDPPYGISWPRDGGEPARL